MLPFILEWIFCLLLRIHVGREKHDCCFNFLRPCGSKKKNWSIVDLQCFRCTTKWFSFIYLYVSRYRYLSIYLSTYLYIFIPHCAACGILVPPQGIKPMPPELGARSLNHWTTREVHIYIIYIYIIYIYILFQILFHYGLLQDIEYSSLNYTVGLCCLPILYTVVCIC